MNFSPETGRGRANLLQRSYEGGRPALAKAMRRTYMDRELIEQYVAGSEKLRRGVAGLTEEEIRARPGPGAWSMLEVVVPLADSDPISIARMKRILSEDTPPLL